MIINSRLQPPQTVYQKSKMSPAIKYPTQEAIPYQFNEAVENNSFGR